MPLRPGLVDGHLAVRGSTPHGGILYVPRTASVPPVAPGVTGWVFELPDGAAVPVAPRIAAIGGIDSDLVRDGDRVRLDGSRGVLTLQDAVRRDVVSVFLQRHDGRILILLRSDRVGSFRRHWAGVSGFLEEASPEAQAYKEVLEETGIAAEALTLAARGRLVFARDGDRVFAIHPFRFRVADVDVRLDWEHTAHAWVSPKELGRRTIVPKLDRVWEGVAPVADLEPTNGND
ncbi:MAG: NUDIX domain-containing protein [Thermoplasmata archaeon]|nr:NUDIX domain-containing protein [Thermoplasmata archaeon]